METDVKYRIVKSEKNYAIQKGFRGVYKEKSVRRSFFRRSVFKSEDEIIIEDFKWRFVVIGDYRRDDEDIVDVSGDNLFYYLPARIYKTKKAAQDALKQHLWDTMVEPINGQEEWKQVNKD